MYLSGVTGLTFILAAAACAIERVAGACCGAGATAAGATGAACAGASGCSATGLSGVACMSACGATGLVTASAGTCSVVVFSIDPSPYVLMVVSRATSSSRFLRSSSVSPRSITAPNGSYVNAIVVSLE